MHRDSTWRAGDSAATQIAAGYNHQAGRNPAIAALRPQRNRHPMQPGLPTFVGEIRELSSR
jgi:hypothetical protein